MKPRKYKWSSMIRETMDAAFLPQAEMADRLKVTQQSVSNWLMGKRNPRAHVIPGLLKLAQDTGLDVRNYESNPSIDRITAYLQKNKGREFIRLLELYDRMGKVGKEKFLKYAVKIGK